MSSVLFKFPFIGCYKCRYPYPLVNNLTSVDNIGVLRNQPGSNLGMQFYGFSAFTEIAVLFYQK